MRSPYRRPGETTAPGLGFLLPTGGTRSTGTRSLRISSIPNSIGADDFRYYLEKWRDVSETNILAMSLAPHGGSQVSTVCFRCEPEILSSCVAGNAINIGFDHGGMNFELTIDCDFFGMTPVHSCPEPKVE